MGLFLRYNLFHGTTAAAVYGSFVSFYQGRGRPLLHTGDDFRRIDFHEESNGWVVVNLDGGWEWKERRTAQLLVSQRLACPGFLVFNYDGNYWGYEFFDRGEVLDHFVQECTEIHVGFPGEDCRGRPQVITERLPFLQIDDVAAYLVQKGDWVIRDGMNVPARPGDEFRRFEECAVLDFLRMLGISIRCEGGSIQLQSAVYRSVFKE